MSGRVLLTGLSSFTGAYIAQALGQAGYDVHATLGSPRPEYEGLKEKRIVFSGVTNFVENASFGDDTFVAAIDEIKPDFFINHGASIEGYRSADFDYWSSVQKSTLNLKEVISRLSKNGCKRLIHTGSFFEPGEGQSAPEGKPEEYSPAMSIYGVSKKITWELLRFACEELSLPLSKIVIPNPVGALENRDRLSTIFVKLWKEGKEPELRTPRHVRDNLPASWLAGVYVEELASVEALSVRRPSAFVLTQKDLVDELRTRVSARLGIDCSYSVKEQDTEEQEKRVNSEPLFQCTQGQPREEFWNSWVDDLVS